MLLIVNLSNSSSFYSQITVYNYFSNCLLSTIRRSRLLNTKYQSIASTLYFTVEIIIFTNFGFTNALTVYKQYYLVR
ncbi:unnamed protein product [Schistosoma rodhaini]|uniref:Uncharacterized protein n=1 Tax=Schistosoma rodhaini TaxID=6188 RepID=A0AA85G3M4_9TREM|nr:unnamed protein product [Schistosoma rodhaini]